MPATQHAGSPWNVPNLLTSLRLLLAIGVIAWIEFEQWWYALVAFSIAAATDWADGYWARKYGQITKVGRIFDPFVDKIIICGTFTALVAVPQSGVIASIAIVVMARELLVTSLRGIIEGAGGDFSARWLGKWKMVVQCAAAIVVLYLLAAPQSASWLVLVRNVLLGLVVLLTVWSGADYVMVAAKALRTPAMKPLEEGLRDG